MKVKSKKLIVVLLILSLMSMGTVYGEGESEEEVVEILDEKILNLEELIKEIERKQKVLNKISRVQNYVKMDLRSNIDKVLEIEKNTPLDMEAAAVVVAYSEKFNINPSLILAVIKQESNFNKYEVGADEDRGYMQVIPSTEKWLANKFGKSIGIKYDPSKIYDPEYNIGLGTIYLSILKKNYGENYNKILSEYNRGPYNLKAYYNKHKTYTTSYSRGVLTKEKKFLKFNK
ncbi:lytic transglycosylase domain-containing protein [Anaeromicrobium sediminis]|uniref:Transglycosylase SLT domain-containing protein n=1 Tax=Anaeromicrobium sediminis TaxID=1478221 RepID=A0A267MML7_9FIRM|nr:transglycosylase SLT domain-containing protein [Anaeromicrobium sediminis]PAB60786.1 hypothetical protein CCE28_04410 [Anaeromicrobium sediminis]